MANPTIKRIDQHPNLSGLAAIGDKLLGIDVSQANPANKTVLIAMEQLTIHNANQLGNDVVESTKIKDGAVTTDKLVNGAVTTEKITDANITVAKLADDAVTTAKIKDKNVTTAKIADTAVTTDKLVNGAVTTEKITDANITVAKLADDALTTAKIKDKNVTTAKIADTAVTTDKLVNGAVTEAKLGTIKRTVLLRVTGSLEAVAVINLGDFFPWAVTLNNFIVVDARINLSVASSSGAVTVVLTNQGGTMSTLSLSAGQKGMSASGAINSTFRTAIANNYLGVNVSNAGTGANGLSITLVLQGIPS